MTIIRSALIQTALNGEANSSIVKIKEAMLEKHVDLIEKAAMEGAEIICLQELFNAPYFPAEQNTKWYDLAERVPEGSTISALRELAKRRKVVIIAPVYEEERVGIFYNTAAVIDIDGRFCGKYRKVHIPHSHPGFWEKFYFTPGDLGYPVFDTKLGRIGVYICYDRHFPEGWRALSLNGAEIVFNPCATIESTSQYLWKLEQVTAACANLYFVGTINRVGIESPWEIGKFYGNSYFVNPLGQIISEGSKDRDEIVMADIDLAIIKEVRNVWQFYRDRRPDSYKVLMGV